MANLFILILVWPLVSATKIVECWAYYQSARHRLGVLVLTALGGITWLEIVVNGIEGYLYYNTPIVWNAFEFWISLAGYAGLGALRYIVFREADSEPATITFERKKYG